jgi:hypothetical protein
MGDESNFAPGRGGEQHRRKQRSGDTRVEKNPPRGPDGRTAEEHRPDPAKPSPAGEADDAGSQ